MSEIYNSSTHGPIPLSFTARRLMQNLREAIIEAIKWGEYSDSRNSVSFARGELAKYISGLEGHDSVNQVEVAAAKVYAKAFDKQPHAPAAETITVKLSDLTAALRAGDVLAHELTYQRNASVLDLWWSSRTRFGSCTYCGSNKSKET